MYDQVLWKSKHPLAFTKKSKPEGNTACQVYREIGVIISTKYKDEAGWSNEIQVSIIKYAFNLIEGG
jgi:hypothetical protein